MIELNGIGRSFEGEAGVRVEALRDITLRIAEGEFVCITGPSGAGKSTLLNILGCLDRPSSGSYRLAGRQVQSTGADGLAWLRRRIFGFVFQSYNLVESATAQENVELPGSYAGLSRRARQKRTKALLAQLDLADRAGHLPGELSGGEQQRVALARALMNGGHVILADEPTGALDRENGEQVLEALERLADAGHTVVMISHNPEIAARAERRIELQDGRLAHDSGPAREKTREPYKAISLAKQGHTRLSRLAGTAHDSWNALRANLAQGARLRTALTVAAILIAVASGALVLSIGEGIYRETVKSANYMGLDTIRVSPKDWLPTVIGHSDPDTGVARNFKPLTLEDAWAIRDEITGVRAVSPEIFLVPIGVRHGEVATWVAVRGYVDLGTKPGRGPLGYRLESGKHITQLEDDNLERVAILEADARTKLFPPEMNPVDQEILIQDIAFRVKGVYSPRQNPTTTLISNSVHIPFKTASALLSSRNEIDTIYVFVQNTDRLLETVSAIRDLGIRRRGSDTLLFGHKGWTIRAAKKNRARLWFVLGTISGCALLAGSLSMMSILLLSVRARRREIGIRMAVGARRRDILLQFFGEAIFVSMAGTVLGALAALAGIPALQRFGVAVEPSLWFFAIPIASALFVGALFGILPARRAAQLDPVAALGSD